MNDIKFYCISLVERTDRRNRINKLFTKLGIEPVWWIVNRHPNGSKYGCFESHVQIWEQNTADIAVIFEDDAEFEGSKEDFSNIIDQIKHFYQKYHTIHLGHTPFIIEKNVFGDFYKGLFMGLVCYLGGQHKLKQLAKLVKPYYGEHIDVTVSQMCKQVGLMPPKFTQNYIDSNNSWLTDSPIINKFPQFEQKLRQKLMKDPYIALKLSPLFVRILFKSLFKINIFYLDKSTIFEYKDRRVSGTLTIPLSSLSNNTDI